MSNPPKVFISYSHDNLSHKIWVKELATYLRKNGIDAILDQWDLALGSDLAKFMEHGLSKSERVLIVLTDKYIEKADSGKGGVGYEKMIATAELFAEQDSNKFIPVVRNVTGDKKFPVFLGLRLNIDLSDANDCEHERIELLKEIHKARESKPPIGINPFAVPVDTLEQVLLKEEHKLEEPSLNVDSTVFFADRFSSAFPGVRGIQWFTTQSDIKMRLEKLLEEPLYFNNASPIWWWRDGNLHIHSFKSTDDGLYLMNCDEFKISKIAAVNEGYYYQKFVYVETEKMDPTGLYPDIEDRTAYWVEQNGYCHEEYGLYKGETKVNRAEYDDNAAMIDGKLVEFDGDIDLRVRYITPYNFVIAANGSPINNNDFDQKLVKLLNAMLKDAESITFLSKEVLNLPKKHQYR